MSGFRPQFKPVYEGQEAKERRAWMERARRRDLVEQLNQPEQLEALHQRMEQAQQLSELDKEGFYDVPME